MIPNRGRKARSLEILTLQSYHEGISTLLLDLSSLLFSTQTPSSLQIFSFSAGNKLAANPLVLQATKTFAPSHPPTSLPIFLSSSCHPYLNSSFLIFFPPPCLTLQILSQILFPTIQTASGLELPNLLLQNTHTLIHLPLTQLAPIPRRSRYYIRIP